VRGLLIRHDQRTATTAGLFEGATRRCPADDKDEVQEIVKRATELEASDGAGAMTIGGVEHWRERSASRLVPRLNRYRRSSGNHGKKPRPTGWPARLRFSSSV
jgi:hypothetical protein